MHGPRWLSLLFAALLSVACIGRAAQEAPVGPSGDLRVALPAPPTTLNPNIELDESAYVIGRSLFSHLVTINEAGQLLPELAESWTTSPDGLTYTFVLRHGVRWHDGRPLTSEDVRWTFEQIVRDGIARDTLTPVAAIDTPDAHTVSFRLKHTWAPFVTELGGFGLAILPRHVYGEGDWRTHPVNRRPIGTGPFRFSEWRDDGTVVLTANHDYFRSGPFVERALFSPASPETIVDALRSSQADVSLTRPPSLGLSSLPLESAVQIHRLPSSARYYLAFNLRRAPFDDVRVRRAMGAAIDRLELVRTPLVGDGAPAIGWYTPDVEWAYNADVRVPDYDLAAARRGLDAAGFRPRRGGERIRTSLLVMDVTPLRELAEALRAQLLPVGIALDVERVPMQDWPKRVVAARDFDLTLIGGAQGPDPDGLRRRFAAAGLGEALGYNSERFRDAVERGARTLDVAARARAYHEAQAILAEDVPFLPLAEAVKIVTYRQGVSGLPQLEARGLVGVFDFSLVRLEPVGTSR